MLSISVLLLVLLALAAANLPWLSEKVFVFLPTPIQGKRNLIRWMEWFVYYFLVGLLALGLETRATGEIHSQDWEFYVTTLCLFLVFALPGFVYRNELQHLLAQRQK
ncbi:MAG: DUF2818 family protein [Gammaproteobacteria bacterium]